MSPSTRHLVECLPDKSVPPCPQQNRTRDNVCNYRELDDRLREGCHVKAEAARTCFNHQNVTKCDPEPYMSSLNVYPDISKVNDCIKEVENQCKQKHITSAKILRTTMQSMEAIIRKIPDVYIIYYVRDPRGIYISRKGFPFDALCSQMKRNHQIYLELNDKYPDVIHFMRYEDLAMDTSMTVKEMFTFLNESIPQAVQDKLSEQTNSESNVDKHGSVYRTNSTYTANAWRDKISQTAYQTSLHQCSDVLKMLNYVF